MTEKSKVKDYICQIKDNQIILSQEKDNEGDVGIDGRIIYLCTGVCQC